MAGFCKVCSVKSGGEPGTFYHVSDIKGREKVENLIARGKELPQYSYRPRK